MKGCFTCFIDGTSLQVIYLKLFFKGRGSDLLIVAGNSVEKILYAPGAMHPSQWVHATWHTNNGCMPCDTVYDTWHTLIGYCTLHPVHIRFSQFGGVYSQAINVFIFFPVLFSLEVKSTLHLPRFMNRGGKLNFIYESWEIKVLCQCT